MTLPGKFPDFTAVGSQSGHFQNLVSDFIRKLKPEKEAELCLVLS
jgi:hypothetical protein